MRSRTPDDLAGRCRACYLPLAICPCAQLEPLHTDTEFVVLRHAREFTKTTNSARWAELALARCSVYDVDGDEDFPLDLLQGPGVAVLLPGGVPVETLRPRRLVVLDGTWRQVRRMIVHRRPLRGLPVASLPGSVTWEGPRLRRAPTEGHLATFEAIAEAVRRLEGKERGEAAARAHRLFVQRVLSTRGRIRPEDFSD
jgi:DTW domain-containing protein YfiP